MTSSQAEVKQIILAWTRAISTGDREAILAHHASDLMMFDFPAKIEGIEAYDETWDFFYDRPRGPIVFEPRDLNVTAGEKVAFASCEIHCDGTSAGPLDLRLTVGLEKRDGEWLITHEHHSVPTTEERFIDPAQASSKPAVAPF